MLLSKRNEHLVTEVRRVLVVLCKCPGVGSKAITKERLLSEEMGLSPLPLHGVGLEEAVEETEFCRRWAWVGKEHTQPEQPESALSQALAQAAQTVAQNNSQQTVELSALIH